MATNKRERINIQDEETLGRPHTAYEKRILRMREYRLTNKENIKKYRTEYYKNNCDAMREYSRKYMKERLDNDPSLREKHNESCKKKYNQSIKKEPTKEELEAKKKIKESKKKLRTLMKQQLYNEQVLKDRNNIQNNIDELKDFLENV